MDRRVTPPTWEPPTPCNQARKVTWIKESVFLMFNWNRQTNLKRLIRVWRKGAGPMTIGRLTQGADAFCVL